MIVLNQAFQNNICLDGTHHSASYGSRRNELVTMASHRKRNGKISIRNGIFNWQVNQEANQETNRVQSITLPYDQITGYRKSEKSDGTYLLLISTRENHEGFVFSFSGGNTVVTE